MTHGTVVVEAAERSGSLITARLAIDYGREVFAVPGRVDSPLSAGTHRLIQQGAKLTARLEDVVDEIAPALRARAASPAGDAADGGSSRRDAAEADQAGGGSRLRGGERAAAAGVSDPGLGRQRAAAASAEPLLDLFAAGPLTIDEVIRESGWPASRVLTWVFEQELRGTLDQLPGKQFQLHRGSNGPARG